MVQPLRIIKKKDWFKKFSVAAEVDQTSNVNTETEFKPTIYHIPPDCIWRMDRSEYWGSLFLRGNI